MRGRWGISIGSKSCSSPGRGTESFFEIGPTYATKYFWAQSKFETVDGHPWPRRLVNLTGRGVFTIDCGTTKGDFLWNGYLLPVVSDRVLRIIEENKLTGHTVYHAEVYKKGELIEGYNGLGIYGKGGPNNPKAYAGGIIPGTSIRRIDGLHPTKWDGSDFFTLDDIPGAVLVTERVKKLFVKEKVTNCRFDRAEDYSVGKGM